MTREVSFGNRLGFGNGANRGEYFFSQGMQRSLFGLMTGYNVIKLKDSTDLSGLGNPQWYADAAGVQYVIDDGGKVWKEATPGVGDFAAEKTVTGSIGNGLIGDQKGRLLAFAATTISKRDGTWADSWKTGLTSYAHPADTYEGMTVFGNKNGVGIIDSSDTMNLNAFDVPSSVNIDCLSSGKHGILLGANLGSLGILMLWNTQTNRSIAPWHWTSGKVQSIARTDSGWIVVTQKEILFTTGYSTRKLFPVLDDLLGYSNYTVAAQGSLVINNKLFVLNQGNGYARLRCGVYIFDLESGVFEFVPVSTQNVTSAVPFAIYAAKASATQEVFVGYKDNFLSKNYIGSLVLSGGQIAHYYSEILASSAKEKSSQAVVLNMGLGTALSSVQTLSVNIAVKLYNFKRPLWGVNVTNAQLADAAKLQVNGTNTALTRPSAGDEITILEGVNAGLSRHVTSIANSGGLNETWTLDAALPSATETSVHVSVQPFVLIERKTITSPAELPELYFNAKDKCRGKKFLVKVVIDSASPQLEMQESELVLDDLGYTT